MPPGPTNFDDAPARLRSGSLSSVSLVEQSLAAIERFEPQVQAWVNVDAEGALAEAARLDAELKAGHDRGPLHGLPLGIKDIFDVVPWPTQAGNPRRAAERATSDAATVARLRRAGGVILGKTVTTQYASFDPSVTHNPWDLSRTPGGSSSGSAAAVAAGMCWGAIGSQTGGSIVRPASFCGVAGFKPGYGEASLAGVVPLSSPLDHPGPIARRVDSLARLWSVMADEPITAPLQQRANVRLGLIEDFFLTECSPDVRETTLEAIERLQSSGICVERATLPIPIEEALTMHRQVMAHGAALAHRIAFAQYPDDFQPQIRRLITEGQNVSPQQYAAALQHMAAFRRAVLVEAARFDALLTPSTLTTAPDMATTGDARFNSPWSYAGVPSVSIPCGLAGDGLPCSIQLISGESWSVLEVAQHCERALAFEAVAPLVRAN